MPRGEGTRPVTDQELVEQSVAGQAADLRLLVARVKALLTMSVIDSQKMPPEKAIDRALEEIEEFETIGDRIAAQTADTTRQGPNGRSFLQKHVKPADMPFI